MSWLLYNICFALVYPLLLPYYFFRMFRRGGYSKDFFQRLGVYDGRTRAKLRAKRRFWIHAVSVGEMFVALRLIKEISALDKAASFIITTTTSTGHAIAEAKIREEDVLAYFPVDFPPVMRRVFSLFNPLALILIESELWPNLIRTAKAENVPVVLANGRISEKSYHGYMKLRPLVSRVLKMLDALIVQGKADAERLEMLGADPEKIHALGSAKYDDAGTLLSGPCPPSGILAKAGINADMPLIVAGSTWPGEEEIMVALLKKVLSSFPDAALVIVPRHVERATEISTFLASSGLAFVRRSELNIAEKPVKIVLVDTTGELTAFYAAATLIFVGKSLTRKGGQNLMEAAAFGKPVLVGPHTSNFKSVMDDFRAASAIIEVKNSDELESMVLKLLGDKALCDTYGERAANLIRGKAGVTSATAALILDLV